MGENTRHASMASEHDVLLRFLHKMRVAVVRTSDGLTAEQQRAPGVPSGTNLLGLIQHLTWAKEHWFERVFLGAEPAAHETSGGRSWYPPISMDVPAERTRDDIVTAYRDACARSDEIVRACSDLSALAQVANAGEKRQVPLRAIVAHMIEETGRHAGHADILREQIDGATDL